MFSGVFMIFHIGAFFDDLKWFGSWFSSWFSLDVFVGVTKTFGLL